MLVEFQFRNFKSYRDDQTLSMVASRLGRGKEDLPGNLTNAEVLGKGTKLLNAAIVYGANASGKSNLIDAVQFVKRFVTNSAERKPGSKIPVKTFSLSEETRNAVSEFEITFLQNDVPYRYGFVIDRERIHEEWLVAYPHKLPQTWYERKATPDLNEEPWYFGPNLKGEKNSLKELTRPNALFLSVAAQFNHEQLTQVYDWFNKAMMIIPATTNWEALVPRVILDIHRNSDLRKQVINLIKMADVGIDNLTTEEGSSAIEDEFEEETSEEIKRFLKVIDRWITDEGKTAQTINAFLFHTTGVDNDESIPFPLSDESLGTRRMLTIAVPLLLTLERGKTLVIDEIDSSLHPVLVRKLVKMFSNPKLNPHGAQLVFNTHDVTLLDNSLLRRDQIWFTEKAPDGATHLYSLQEFKPRKTEAFSKNYLQGRYGAIPIIDSIAAELHTSG